MFLKFLNNILNEDNNLINIIYINYSNLFFNNFIIKILNTYHLINNKNFKYHNINNV